MYDHEVDEKIKAYNQENGYPFDNIPNETEWKKFIWSVKYPQWFQDWTARKKEIYNTAVQKLQELTGVTLKDSYKQFKLFEGWLKMPFAK